MGKKDRTDKKARTNQIEALRKKYEALLLEDKKRKERNQYILEKMDTMRTCTTLVHKNTSNIQKCGSFLLPNINSSVLQAKATDVDIHFNNSFHHKTPDTLAHTNATEILKDIYNNFILIPKVLPTKRDNSAQVGTTKISENDANSDWKSKYDILDKLKQEEKEDIGNSRAELNQSRYLQQFDDCPNQPISQEKSGLLRKDIMVKKDKNSENYDLSERNSFIEPTSNFAEDTSKQHSYENLHPTSKKEAVEIIQFNNRNPPTKLADMKDYPFSKIEGSEKIEHLDNEGINPVQISYNTEDVGKPFGEVPPDTDDVQYPIDVIDVHDFTPEKDVNVQDGVNINSEGYNLNKSHFEPFSEDHIPSEHAIRKDCVNVTPEEMNTNQTSFDPIFSQNLENDTIAVPLEIEKGDPIQQGILDAALAYQTSDNVPQNTATTEQSFNTLQTVPVPEHCENFDVIGEAENAYVPQQQEVFYQEPISEVQYDQTAAGDTWGTTANDTIGQDEPYYYEGQDQQAPVYVNEHEETSTLYDQNYEQQYVANYEQQEFPEVSQAFHHVGQPQEYETEQYDQQEYDQAAYSQEAPVDQYNQDMEYDQQQHQQENYDTVQQVDEQLSQEEGYADVNQAEVEAAKTPDVSNDNEQPPKM